MHHIWLRTTVCENWKGLQWSAQHRQLSSSCSLPGSLLLSQIFGSRQEAQWAGLCYTISCPYNNKMKAKDLNPSVSCKKECPDISSPPPKSWSHDHSWTHGRCSFLRGSRCECSHTRTCPHCTSRTHPSADRGSNSMGSLWKQEGDIVRKWKRDQILCWQYYNMTVALHSDSFRPQWTSVLDCITQIEPARLF